VSPDCPTSLHENTGSRAARAGSVDSRIAGSSTRQSLDSNLLPVENNNGQDENSP